MSDLFTPVAATQNKAVDLTETLRNRIVPNSAADFKDALLRFQQKSEKPPKKTQDMPSAEIAAMMQSPASAAIVQDKEVPGNADVPDDMDVNNHRIAEPADTISQLRNVLDELAVGAGYADLNDLLSNPRTSADGGEEALSVFAELLERLELISSEDAEALAAGPQNARKQSQGDPADALMQVLNSLLETLPEDHPLLEARALLERLTRFGLEDGLPVTDEDEGADVSDEALDELLDTQAQTDASAVPDAADVVQDGAQTDAGDLPYGQTAAAAAGSTESADADAVPLRDGFAAHLNGLHVPVHTTGATGTATAATPLEAHVAQQIVETVQIAQQQGRTEMRLQLAPEFLGQVSIVLSMGPEGMKARITAETSQAQQVLSQQISQLADRLRASGIDMQSIEVTQQSIEWDMSRGQPQSDTSGQPRQRHTQRVTGLTEINTAPLQTEVYNMAAVSGIPGDLSADAGVEYFA